MFYVKHCSLVPYNVKQMFNLINDINSYNQFVPGCSTIKILEQTHNELIAEIIPINNKIVKSIITHNFFVENKSIIMHLKTNLFKNFCGNWRFIAISEKASRVEYISYYEFKSIFFEKIYNYLFQEICGNIIKIFIVRANQIYDISNTTQNNNFMKNFLKKEFFTKMMF